MIDLKKILIKEQLFDNGRDWGIAALRIIPSFYMFYYHGLRKITNGTKTWNWVGEAVMPMVGIEFGYVFFGFLAALSEGVLTWFVIIGLWTRISSIFLMITMLMAGVYHLVDGEAAELAFIYFSIYLVICILGPGKYSLDQKIYS